MMKEKISSTETHESNPSEFNKVTDDTGPSKWKKLFDPETSKYYFFNIDTNETTWDLPVKYQKSADDQADLKMAAEGESQNGNSLSPNAADGLHPDNEGTNATHPSDSMTANSQTNGLTVPNGGEMEPGHLNDAAREGEQAMYDQAGSKYQSFSGAAETPNWRTAIDHNTGQQYYYNVVTGETQWTSPTEMAQQVPVTGDYTFQTSMTGRRRRRSMKEMQDAWDRGDRVGLWECPDCSKILTEGSKKTHPDSCNARKARSVHMVQGTPTDILAGAHWRAVQDRNGQTYYYHQISKKTSWYKPTEMSNFEQYQQNQAIIQNTLGTRSVGLNQWTQVTDPNGRTYFYNNITGATSWTKPQNGPNDLKPQAEQVGEWIEVVDSTSGNKYYYNSVTKATSWKNPSKPSEPETQIKQQEQNVNKRFKSENSAELQNIEAKGNAPEMPAEDGVFGAAELAQTTAEGSGLGDSFDGENPWREAFDKTTGRKYYYNVLTQNTTWEMPPELIRSSEEKPQETAPAEVSNWKAVLDEKTGKTYYYNVETKETMWENPLEKEKLPEKDKTSEWLKVTDEKTGQFYYHNTVTGETTWDAPIEHQHEDFNATEKDVTLEADTSALSPEAGAPKQPAEPLETQ